jgi:hypothetical protein
MRVNERDIRGGVEMKLEKNKCYKDEQCVYIFVSVHWAEKMRCRQAKLY